MSGIEVIGLDQIKRNFNKFSFTQRRAKEKYLDLIGDSAVELLRTNTPVDTAALKRSWQVLGR